MEILVYSRTSFSNVLWLNEVLIALMYISIVYKIQEQHEIVA